MGTDSGGLNMLRDQKFTTYTTKDGLSGNFVRCVLQSSTGRVVDRHRRGGIESPHQHRLRPRHHRGRPVQQRDPFARRRGGRRPVGRHPRRAEPSAPRTAGQRGWWSDSPPPTACPTTSSARSTPTATAAFGIGTRHGLAHRTGGRFTSYSSLDGLGSDFIGAIFRAGLKGDLGGDLWIGTSGGLSRLHDGVFTNYTVQQGLSNNIVTAIAQDRQGTLWLGTNGGGLNRLRQATATIQAFPSSSQALPGTIYGIARRRQRSSLAQLPNRHLPGFDRTARRLCRASGQLHRGHGLRHGGRHEHPRVQRRRPPGGMEAGRRKPVVRHPRRRQFHRSRARAGKPRAASCGASKRCWWTIRCAAWMFVAEIRS